MRKITEEGVEAFNTGVEYRNSNTSVQFIGDGKEIAMYLFGNRIAWRKLNSDVVWITNCGWKSNTTKERLNGLDGVKINQSKGVWYLNGTEWNGDWIKINK